MKRKCFIDGICLHGLAAHSLISKKVIEGKTEFKDLIGSMMNLGK
jgi:magnesium chelatase subunit I